MGYNYRLRICIMATVDIILSVIGLTWVTYMYNFVVYDYSLKYYLGADSNCFNKIKNVETKVISQQYLISLTLYGISMIGFTLLAIMLMILTTQEPTRRLPLIFNVTGQLILLILEVAACAVFAGENLCSLNNIPNRFDHTQRWPLQVIILIITLLFVLCYKPFELWCVVSMISELSIRKNPTSGISQQPDLPGVESDRNFKRPNPHKQSWFPHFPNILKPAQIGEKDKNYQNRKERVPNSENKRDRYRRDDLDDKKQSSGPYAHKTVKPAKTDENYNRQKQRERERSSEKKRDRNRRDSSDDSDVAKQSSSPYKVRPAYADKNYNRQNRREKDPNSENKRGRRRRDDSDDSDGTTLSSIRKIVEPDDEYYDDEDQMEGDDNENNGGRHGRDGDDSDDIERMQRFRQSIYRLNYMRL